MIKATDPFDRAATTEPPPLPTKYVSTTSVAVGEGLRFSVNRLEWVDDPNNSNPEAQVREVTGHVIESRARKFFNDQQLVITCSAIRLEQMANELANRWADHLNLGTVVTLVRGEDEGKLAGWRWWIENEQEAVDV